MSPPGSLFPPDWGRTGLVAGSYSGGAKVPPPGRRFNAHRGLPLALPPGDERYAGRGYLPASFPPAYDDHILALAAHPQMLAAHAKMIGTDRLRFDHSLLMNRPAAAPGEANSGWGRNGRKWHSHPYDQDGWGVAARARSHCRSAQLPTPCTLHQIREGTGWLCF